MSALARMILAFLAPVTSAFLPSLAPVYQASVASAVLGPESCVALLCWRWTVASRGWTFDLLDRFCPS